MTDKKKKQHDHCDDCGEPDGTVKAVGLRIGRRVAARRRLCRSCQYTVIVAFAAPSARR